MGGRANNGGGRFGDMEGAAVAGSGAAYALHERFVTSSDGVPSAVCLRCGSAARRTVGLQRADLRCSRRDCVSHADATLRDFRIDTVPHAFNLLTAELRGAGIMYTAL